MIIFHDFVAFKYFSSIHKYSLSFKMFIDVKIIINDIYIFISFYIDVYFPKLYFFSFLITSSKYSLFEFIKDL